MEHGLTESQHEAPGVHQDKAKEITIASNTPPQIPTVTHYQSTYSVSAYLHPGHWTISGILADKACTLDLLEILACSLIHILSQR